MVSNSSSVLNNARTSHYMFFVVILSIDVSSHERLTFCYGENIQQFLQRFWSYSKIVLARGISDSLFYPLQQIMQKIALYVNKHLVVELIIELFTKVSRRY